MKEETALTKTPALNFGSIRALCDESPLHCWTNHRRLNPNYVEEVSTDFDLGKVVHALFLQGLNIAEVIDAKDWRTKEAKEARDLARAAGKIPLLPGQMARAKVVVKRIREQLDEHKDSAWLFQGGEAEKRVEWEEDGIQCVAVMDWCNNLAVADLKTTGISANPEAFSRALYGNGYDVQAAWYRRGYKAVYGKEVPFKFVVVEMSEPHALSVIRPGDEILALAEKKIMFAKELWSQCLKTGVWPGYLPRTAVISLPQWEETRWVNRELATVIS